MSGVEVKRYVELKFLLDECPKGGGCRYGRCAECALNPEGGRAFLARRRVKCQHPEAKRSSERERRVE